MYLMRLLSQGKAALRFVNAMGGDDLALSKVVFHYPWLMEKLYFECYGD